MITPLLLLALSAHAAPVWHDTLPEALSEAQAKKAVVLVDFVAPWCYSCYFMDKKVLSRPKFAAAAEGLVLAKMDVDRAEGMAARNARAVTYLPTYLLLDSDGKELGRIYGEQSEEDFLDKLAAIRATAKPLPADPELVTLRAKLAKGDLAAFSKILDRPATCELSYDVLRMQPELARAKEAVRHPLVSKARARIDELARAKIFVAEPKRCADMRSGVEAVLALNEPGKKAVLEKTLAMLGYPDEGPGDDRSRDDNVRYFLELKDDEKLGRWYERLIEAYPADYVYAYRFAKYLESRDRDQEALPWIEKADKLAYGANRLQVTLLRAKILTALDRREEAQKLAARDLKAATGSFPMLERPLAAWLSAQKP